MARLLLTYYGDDFTGSTDSMEALALGGVRVALFLEPPPPEALTGRFAELQAVGVAGISRSLSPAQMEIELRPKFRQLKALGARLCHYKTCSTFDSSPQVGSIGYATDIGWEVFEPPFVPVIVGAPALKRYLIFGNLFATVGAETFRLDRHPTMSKHPVTPMAEADLRRHLARQTRKSMALFDLLHLAGSEVALDQHLQSLRAGGPEIIFFDTLENDHLTRAGRLIWKVAEEQPDKSLFVVGSSGVEYALTAHWQALGLVDKPLPFASPGTVEQIIVVSGSASPGTANQISWALDNGFTGLRLHPSHLLNPEQAEAERAAIMQQALAVLGGEQSVILYTAHGPDDPAIVETRAWLQAQGIPPEEGGRRLAEQQGLILRSLLEATGLRRACVAGGDTSSYAAQQLGVYALEMLIPVAPGAPLCRASSHESRFDGLEITLKGGQVGQPHFFGQIRAGRA
jgi:3-oxoisoapionate kinase